ncbi:LCP family protein [Candidatus Synechococcus calcipolaris G9]|uniref:LCP family protein n=1 Tax=Candidatus Synechococcus calcipolaris G9 TaxID=1497997 RepID=A0ABT6F316_9SYNE|nr:LCP family protein [Candidatus Synechococcus calcipolaris]MDG2992259.1 LCP family protein [Candidatus Synechococcus calcipolaris G9]
MFIHWRPSQKKSPPSNVPLFWRTLNWCGVALISASLGGLWALITHSTPLMHRALSPQESAVFSRNRRDISTLDQPVNLLLIGTKVLSSDVVEPPVSDATYHTLVNSVEGLSDTMLLVRFDPRDQRLTILSIPRDTLTWIPGRGDAKINEANALGGPALAAQTVSELLGDVPIDRYLRINVQGISKLVDALGGVTIHVPKDMRYQDMSQRLNIDLQEGRQHLDGEKALDFLRFRYDELGDIGRVQRQQSFMRALIEQTAQPDTLGRLPQILGVIRENLDTNLTVQELASLAGFMAQVPRSRVQMLMLPGDFNGTGREEISYWLPSYRQIEVLADQHLRDTPRRSGLGGNGLEENPMDVSTNWIRIAIQNTYLPEPQVERVSDHLSQVGFRNLYRGEDMTQPLKVTRIIAQAGDIDKARAVQLQLGFGEVRVESTGVLDSDVTIQLGEDALYRLSGFGEQPL